MSNKTEAAVAILAALIVLFTAILEPRVSAGIAVVALVALGFYHFTKRRG